MGRGPVLANLASSTEMRHPPALPLPTLKFGPGATFLFSFQTLLKIPFLFLFRCLPTFPSPFSPVGRPSHLSSSDQSRPRETVSFLERQRCPGVIGASASEDDQGCRRR